MQRLRAWSGHGNTRKGPAAVHTATRTPAAAQGRAPLPRGQQPGGAPSAQLGLAAARGAASRHFSSSTHFPWRRCCWQELRNPAAVVSSTAASRRRCSVAHSPGRPAFRASAASEPSSTAASSAGAAHPVGSGAASSHPRAPAQTHFAVAAAAATCREGRLADVRGGVPARRAGPASRIAGAVRPDHLGRHVPPFRSPVLAASSTNGRTRAPPITDHSCCDSASPPSRARTAAPANREVVKVPSIDKTACAPARSSPGPSAHQVTRGSGRGWLRQAAWTRRVPHAPPAWVHPWVGGE